MSWPIAADGTCRYSTGRPGRENAPAVAGPPTTPIRPESRAAPTAPTTSRRGMRATAPRNLSTNVILASSSSRRALHKHASLIGVELQCDLRSSARVVNHTVGVGSHRGDRANVAFVLFPNGFQAKHAHVESRFRMCLGVVASWLRLKCDVAVNVGSRQKERRSAVRRDLSAGAHSRGGGGLGSGIGSPHLASS